MHLHGTQDLGQLGRPELAGSACAVAVSGETRLGHDDEVKPGPNSSSHTPWDHGPPGM